MTAAMEKECKMDGIPSEQSITGCKAVSRQFLKTTKNSWTSREKQKYLFRRHCVTMSCADL